MVTISLKPIGGIPGDASDAQMDAVADLAEEYAFDEIRVTHEQNLGPAACGAGRSAKPSIDGAGRRRSRRLPMPA